MGLRGGMGRRKAMTDEEYWKQGTERLEELTAAVDAIIGTFPEPRRSQVRRMMDGPVGEQFFLAPASSRRAYHSCFPGGLAVHSLAVAQNAVRLADVLFPGRWPRWRVLFCGLFHDLGKAGPAGMPNYIPVSEKWKREKGEFYEVKKTNWLPTAEQGLFILQQEGIPLEHEEYLAIRLNDGAGPPENGPYSFRTPALALLTHWSDHAASVSEKEADRQGP